MEDHRPVMRERAPTLGLSVIAKNAAGILRACLKSVEGLVDAMVVIDTRSTDAPAEFAQDCRATVVLFPWTNDFSAARNATLAALKTDWVPVLDADAELDEKAYAWIRGELQRPAAEGYVVPVRNYLQPWDQPLTGQFSVSPEERHPGAPHAESYLHSQVCRLFRHDPHIYHVGHLHEQVEYRLMDLGRPMYELRLHAAIAMQDSPEAIEAADAIARIHPSSGSIMRHVVVLNHFGKGEKAHGVITRGLEVFPSFNELQQAERELKSTLPIAMVLPETPSRYDMQLSSLCSQQA